jgi:GLPGLI family protein
MKKIMLAALLLTCSSLMAQKTVSRAIVKTITNMEFPENATPGGDGGDRMFGRDVELNSTIYYKGDMTKIETETDFGKNLIFVDRKARKTTTLMEVMGRKMGFYSSDEDQEKMQKRMDSLRNLRRDSLEKAGIRFAPPAEPEIVYTDEKKKIAGMDCKKAVIRTKSRQGEMNETTVWYAPEIKMGPGFTLAAQGGGGMRMMGFNPAGMEKINGFPMEYEIVRQNGMKIHLLVTKVQLEPEIDDKTFDIPKGYDIKPMSDMQGAGGRIMMRMSQN